MSVLVFLAVLGAALLHATWNALVKTNDNKLTAMLVFSVCQAFWGFAVVIFLPWPEPEVWPWLIASGLIHLAYQLFLAFAYEKGDLSRVYPIARGAAPMIVLLVSVTIGLDPMQPWELVGILVLGLGILWMAQGVFASGEDRKLIPFALGAACATASYSLVDGIGARISGEPLAYVAWLLILSGVFFIPAILVLRGPEVLPRNTKPLKSGLIASLASLFAYGIVVWAMTQAPIALVTALRESSILFAMLLGWLIFGDKMGRTKIMAGALIVLGVVITRL